MDVVLIIAWNRAEYLTLCLEQIATNKDFKNKHYLLNLDHGYRKDNESVFVEWCKENNLRYSVNHIPPTPYKVTKQSYAVFSGYQLAHTMSDRYIYMIEDDIMVSDRFFEWHEKAQKLNPFCSIATTSNNTKTPEGTYDDYIELNSYQSLGVCWYKDSLNEVLDLITDDYYKNPIQFIRRNFPNSDINVNFCEQDGVINRMARSRKVIYPLKGYAYHSGIYGYHRSGKKITGTLDEKVVRLRQIIFNPDAMKKFILDAGDPVSFYEDSKPIPLQIAGEIGELKEVK